MLLRPHEVDLGGPAFVQATVRLTRPPGYPSVPAEVHLAEERGLGEVRAARLQSAVAAESSSLAGTESLVLLCEAVRELLAQDNWPLGPCPICLHALCPEETTAAAVASANTVCLPCFHSFHK